ncbi:hypothetical protein Btru_022120, partial [Bulinus truncatus]
ADLVTLCYIWFPFCACLKNLAIRKLSVSTNDSMYNKRFSSIRKNHSSLLNRQSVYKNGSKVYIEFRRDRESVSRGRSNGTMNDFFKDGSEGQESSTNGFCDQCCHFHRARRQNRRCYKTRRRETARSHRAGVSLVTTSDVSDEQQTSSGDDVTTPCSPASPALKSGELLCHNDGHCGSIRLNPLPEIDASDL